MRIIETKYIKFRITILGFLFTAFLSAIGAKAGYLQIYQSSWLSKKASAEYERPFKELGKRGTIYDANLREMAVSINSTSIAAFTRKIKNPAETARLLATSLNMDSGILRERLLSKKPFIWVKRQATPKEVGTVKNLKIDGIEFMSETSRFYPQKTLAAQTIGFTGMDGKGLEGIEFYYDNQLKGSDFEYVVLKDALGQGFDSGKSAADYSGKNIVLTVDQTIQYITEKALKEAVDENSAKSGIAVVMSPKTGAILSIAQYPSLNPNAYEKFDRDLWRNRAITDPFEPGSTMKIFTAAAAVEYGNCSENEVFFCENGEYRIGKHIIHDTHSYGWLTLKEVVKLSSNIGAFKLASKTGPERLYKTLKDFGFGEKTGINCPGETSGIVSSYKNWRAIDIGTIAFGQGISASPLQLISAVSAIANDGILMKPYIVQSIMDQNGFILNRFDPAQVRQAISPATAAKIKNILMSVTEKDGTGFNAALEGYTVCGKTGTAQKTDETGRYAKGKYISSFVGFTPAENPQVAILVMVDEPARNHYGGIVSAPAFKKIAQETLTYMNVQPKNRDAGKLRVSRERELLG
ncbi:MAG: penicillin-binding protein 2 [Desulfobacteraceae bacterium]|nr:MAG: penicillin-binding protein 2 [Desulfobacteraceae bacterium]